MVKIPCLQLSKSKRDALLNNVSNPVTKPMSSEPDNITESWLCVGVDCGVNTAPGFSPGPILREALETKGASEQSVGFDTEIYIWSKIPYGNRQAWNHPVDVCASVAWKPGWVAGSNLKILIGGLMAASLIDCQEHHG